MKKGMATVCVNCFTEKNHIYSVKKPEKVPIIKRHAEMNPDVC